MLAFDGLLNEAIAERVGLTHRQVGRWRRRWANAWHRLIDIRCRIEQTVATDPEGSWVFLMDNLNILNCRRDDHLIISESAT